MSEFENPNPMLCYIIDIDGTIADVTHRLHHIQSTPKNWDAFFEACDGDAPIEHMRALTNALGEAHAVVYASGRPERTRAKTWNWIVEHGFGDGVLYMRADGDHRDDSIVKAEMLDRIRADGYQPLLAFEDRSRVVEMWRRLGIPCAQVAPGDF